MPCTMRLEPSACNFALSCSTADSISVREVFSKAAGSGEGENLIACWRAWATALGVRGRSVAKSNDTTQRAQRQKVTWTFVAFVGSLRENSPRSQVALGNALAEAISWPISA